MASPNRGETIAVKGGITLKTLNVNEKGISLKPGRGRSDILVD